jgi:hypothetical protein
MNLLTACPDLAAEWHPTRNGALSPAEVSAGSGRKVWWRCQAGHEWAATVANRTGRGSGCPFCSGRRPSPERNLESGENRGRRTLGPSA